jgi:two-component system, response regulator YesN
LLQDLWVVTVMYKVLLVDDNYFDREGIRDFIHWDDLRIREVRTAVNGEEGYRLATEFKPDIIITDISMPVMNGLEMIRLLQSSGIGAKYIIMSCHDEFAFAQTAIQYGVSEYILKPVTVEDMEISLRQVIAQIRADRQNEDRLRDLKVRLRESLPSLQSDMLREIMIFDDDIGERLKKLEYLDMHFSEGTLVAVVKADPIVEYPGGLDKNSFALTYILKEKFAEIFRGSGNLYSYAINKNSLCYVITSAWRSAEECYDEAIGRFAILKDEILKASGRSVTIGIGSYVSDIRDLPLSYKRAEESANSAFFSRGNQIVLYSDINPDTVTADVDYFEVERDVSTILSGTSEDIAGFIRRYFDRGGCSEDYIRNFCYLTVLLINKNLAEQGIGITDLAESSGSLWKKIGFFKTADEAKSWLSGILSGCIEVSSAHSNKRRKVVVEQIKDRIDRDFASITSLSAIAREFFISPGHANNIFKQEYGITMGDYLFHTRMENAKKLLKNPVHRVYEVSTMVGYISKSYFSACFQEYTGITPRDYRDKYSVKVESAAGGVCDETGGLPG